jgi:hypothetical protein
MPEITLNKEKKLTQNAHLLTQLERRVRLKLDSQNEERLFNGAFAVHPSSYLGD